MAEPPQNESSDVGQIIERHRADLRRIVRLRLDERLIRRLDPSDVVQDVFAVAAPQVPQWIEQNRSVYACLYQLTRDRLARIHRDHLARQTRAVDREQAALELPDGSFAELAHQLVCHGASPSNQVLRVEERDQVRAALQLLKETEREILVMRILEGLPAKEVGQILGISEDAVNMRQIRALDRIRPILTRLRGER